MPKPSSRSKKKLLRCWAPLRRATASHDRGHRCGCGSGQRNDGRNLCRAGGLTSQRQRRQACRRRPHPAVVPRRRPTPTRALTVPQSGRWFSICCMRHALPTRHRPRSMPAYSTKVSTTARSVPCIACSRTTTNSGNAVISHRRPVYRKPELLAERPNQVWSWDITKLMGPTKWSYFYLYVILDIFSRRVVGWCVADAESAMLFRPLLDDAIAKHQVAMRPVPCMPIAAVR